MDDCTIIHERRVCQIPKNKKKKIARNDKYTSININSMIIGSELVNWRVYSSSIVVNFGQKKSYEK